VESKFFTLAAALNQAFKAACISVLAVEPTSGLELKTPHNNAM
jgi:hypothetical protein